MGQNRPGRRERRESRSLERAGIGGYTGRADTAHTQDNEYGNCHTGQRAIHHPEALSKLDKAAHEDETRDQKKR